MAILAKKLDLTPDTWQLIGTVGMIGRAIGGVLVTNATDLPTGDVPASIPFENGQALHFSVPAAGNLYVKGINTPASLIFYEV